MTIRIDTLSAAGPEFGRRAPQPVGPPDHGPAGAARLIGREAERELLRTFVRDASSGGAARVLCGGAGSGKSELLEAGVALGAAAGMSVLRCAGVRGSAPSDLSGLLQMLWPLLGDARLPSGSGQLRALEALLVDGAPGRRDRARLPFTVLEVLESVGVVRPLLIAVDDWDALDSPSADVLMFVARRCAGHPLGLLMTSRTPPAGPLSPGLPVLSLGPMTLAESAALLAARRPGHDPQAVRDLMARAAGNPLALLELPARTDDFPPHLPASSDRLAAALAPGAARLPAATRDLLLLAALHPAADIPLLLSAASRMRGGDPLGLTAVEPAERLGLVVLDGMRVDFTHPAVAGAVAHGTGPRTCRRAHAALAAELTRGSVLQLWHLSQSVEGHDPHLAARLEDVHRSALRQNEPAMALRLLRRAAGLYSAPRDQGRCLLRAAQLAHGAGWTRTSRSLARHASDHPLGPLGSLYAETLTGLGGDAPTIDPARWPRPEGAAETDSALELAHLVAPLLTDDRERADALLGYLDALPPEVAGDPRLLHAMASAAPVRRAATVLARLAARGPDIVAIRDLERLGEAALRAGAPLEALDLHRQAERLCLFHDLPDRLPATVLGQGLAHLVTGDWGQAETAFRRSREEAERRALSDDRAAAEILERLTCALRTGTVPEPADSDALAAGRVPVSALHEIVAVGTGWARVESGDVAAGHAALDRLLADPARCTPALFALVVFAEAAAAVNEAGTARARLRSLERDLGPERAPLVAVELAVAQAILADDENAAALFERAFHMDLAHRPFLEASLRLAHGRWLRRQHEFTDSRVTLRQAAATFAMMGAEARVTRITEELRASGQRTDTATAAGTRPAPVAGLLSAQELRIARLAGRGLSNRQIGQELGLSPRTIGAYLYRIFPRLGVTARAQLSGVLRSADEGVEE
ncbi:LuxR C-terminal-related transcriptional regulator [Streptomyces sp. HUAS MG91]|uniref:LuxR C-terminal-related transcriptional regulator n=1 Tax=Streptomyces tabacisoli TaxID=3156398 RepID=A0AAU8IJV4_9ACTN